MTEARSLILNIVDRSDWLIDLYLSILPKIRFRHRHFLGRTSTLGGCCSVQICLKRTSGWPYCVIQSSFPPFHRVACGDIAARSGKSARIASRRFSDRQHALHNCEAGCRPYRMDTSFTRRRIAVEFRKLSCKLAKKKLELKLDRKKMD